DEADPPAGGDLLASAFPVDADRRIARVNGVVTGGVFWSVPEKETAASGTRPWPSGPDAQAVTVVAATPGMLRAAKLHLTAGTTFDEFHDRRAEPVTVVSHSVAERLHLKPLETHPVIFVGGTALYVIGVYDGVVRQPDLLLSIVVPAGFASQVWGAPTSENPAAMVVETALGAAQQVASQAAVALRPQSPERLRATAPPDPRDLREQVNADVSALLVVLAGLSLVVGALGIANSTLVAVMERVGEIGLRRAVGARPRHIAGQFLVESTALGTIGGLIGTALGSVGVVLLSLVRGWTPLMEPGLVIVAPFIGTLVGLLAGMYPAWRAARIEPVEALRR
ncbi:MAG TPA: ABC transporter permease, partial [Candidatus Lustribacter sp.]|nr:ABC transporter permease [Candidatus Lustribacter sp.]